MDIRRNIETLFQYIEQFEQNESGFQAEAFMQTYSGIRAVFKTLLQDRNQAVEIDYVFLDYVQRKAPSSSPLRNITAQVLLSFFEAEADPDNRSNQAWSYVRSLRPVRPDGVYIEEHLSAELVNSSALRDQARLGRFLLSEMSAYLNKYGRPLDAQLTPESFGALEDSQKLLMLCRRRLQLGENLLIERSSLEFDLDRTDALRQLGDTGPFYNDCLSDWGYLQTSNFWSRVKSIVRPWFSKTKELFLSFRYTRLLFSQRRPAYFLQIVIILAWIGVAVLAPVLWLDYSDRRFDDLHRRLERVRDANDRVGDQ